MAGVERSAARVLRHRSQTLDIAAHWGAGSWFVLVGCQGCMYTKDPLVIRVLCVCHAASLCCVRSDVVEFVGLEQRALSETTLV